MDWANQPIPFRNYSGTKTIHLPLIEADNDAEHGALYNRGGCEPGAITMENTAAFLELSMGLSAWKAVGQSRWALRMNPSSGNLHPTESHLVLPAMDGLAAGVYHYNPLIHGLELRAEMPDPLWGRLHSQFEANGFFIALTSIFWRESWKYGERAFRYCNLDVGHALAGISVAAGLYGWQTTCLNALSDDDVATIIGLTETDWHPQEKEHPDLLCFVHDHPSPDVPRNLSGETLAAFSDLTWQGTPNRLSRETLTWEIIDQAAELSQKPATPEQRYVFHPPAPVTGVESTLTAHQIIRKRRSATAFNRDGAMASSSFLSMLDRTLPRNGTPPFDVELGAPMVHLLLFVHNVTDMAQGLYFFCRNKDHMAEIRQLSRPDFLWEPAAGQLPLFRLTRDDVRIASIEVSCNQDIAGYSAFSLGMIANFKKIVKKEPFRYRHLYWECGMIGQVLYLEAEAMGVRGTGIGCFFDDPVLNILGLQDNTYQSLYHFTVGLPVKDPRLTTYPPYSHLKKSKKVS